MAPTPRANTCPIPGIGEERSSHHSRRYADASTHETTDEGAESLAEVHGLTFGSSQKDDCLLRDMFVQQFLCAGFFGSFTRSKKTEYSFHWIHL